MEHDPRPFQAVNIGMTSVETGRERFFRDDYYHGPPLAAWRCNLTALSHRYNLYFIATREGVAVYQPQFPFQKLHQKPQLNIPPTLANATAAGYIDDWRPHGINHLMVGDLGSEEILLVATDSGNIAAYHTRAIEEAIKKDPYKFSDKGRSDVVGLRAFFSQWVHESAWGLAIHRQGRMIAVSANKPHHVASQDPSAKVTVFAFALTSRSNDTHADFDDPDASKFGELQDWYDWDPEQSEVETPYRDRNFRITLGGDTGHINNVPSISFVNSSEDIDGSWLLSTDITGIMKLWRIWKGSCYASYDCEGSSHGVTVHRQRDAGWIVAALDPSSFRPALSMDQFCGYRRPRSAPQYHGHPSESYDITNIVRLKTPGRSQRHPLMGEHSDDEFPPEDEEVAEEWTDEDVEEPDRKRDLILGLDSLRLPSSDPTQASIRASIVPAYVESATGQSVPPTSSNPSTDSRATQATQARTPAEHNFITLEPVEVDSAVEESDESYESDEEEEDLLSGSPASHTSLSSTTQRTSVEAEASPLSNTSPALSGDNSQSTLKNPYRPLPISPKRQRQDGSAKEELRISTIAALQCSQFHVRLLNIPKARSPHFFCANILTQDLPEGMEMSNYAHLARLSMIQSIPELGIIIIASQLGRCAVCTLTKTSNNNALGLRVDWILPTRRQERAGHRPMHPLLGIAVAPVQGRTFQSSGPERDDDQDETQEWLRDRTVHGVNTTFDRTVLVLDKTARDHRDNEDSSDGGPSSRHQQDRARRKRSSKPRGKRLRPSDSLSAHQKPRSSHSSLSSQASSSSRPFPVPEPSDSWAAVESSRRYSLMLTYLDMTVLTYEIERAVEREDIKGCESGRTTKFSKAEAGLGAGSGSAGAGASAGAAARRRGNEEAEEAEEVNDESMLDDSDEDTDDEDDD